MRFQITTLQDEIQHLQADITALKSGSGPMESLDRTDGINPSPLMQKREIQRLTDELLRSDAGQLYTILVFLLTCLIILMFLFQ